MMEKLSKKFRKILEDVYSEKLGSMFRLLQKIHFYILVILKILR